MEEFGGIDKVVENASAVNLNNTENLNMKRYDLMSNINTRGTFLLTKACLLYLKQNANLHIFKISPPLFTNTKWFENHVAYRIAKYGISMCV